MSESDRPSNTTAGRVWLKTLGCKANLHDSEGVLAGFVKQGWIRAGSEREADLVVVNTCTVTDEAEKESRRQVRLAARRNPGAKIFVTGCAVEVNPDAFRDAALGSATVLVGARDRAKLAEGAVALARGEGAERLGEVQGYAELASRHPMDRDWPAVSDGFGPVRVGSDGAVADRTRVFLKIQEGCDTFCTYCIIPYGRGPSRSLPVEQAVARARELVAAGARELVLTGTNLGEHENLDRLIGEVLDRTEIERLRVSSLDPTQITPFLYRLAAEDPRFCPHFHVSLQSPVTRVLRGMKRAYSTADVEECLSRIGAIRPAGGIAGGVFVGMDVITGFSGESDRDFEETLEILERLPWTRLHVFPYSERAETPATRMPGSVDRVVRRARADRLLELSLERYQRVVRRAISESRGDGGVPAGKLRVLAEGGIASGPDGRGGWWSGHTSNYLHVLWRPTVGAETSRNAYVELRPRELWVDRAAGEVAILGGVTVQ